MTLARQDAPGFRIGAAHCHEHASGKARFMGQPQTVEHVDPTGPGEDAAFRGDVEHGRNLAHAHDRRVEAGNVRCEPGGIGHHPHLAQVGHRDGWQLGQQGPTFQGLGNRLIAQVPYVVEAGHLGRPGFGRDAAGRRVVDEVVLARFASGDDVHAERLGPGDEVDEQARLVTVDRRADEAARRRPGSEDRANDGLGLLGHQCHVLAMLDRGRCGHRTRLGLPTGFDQDVEGQMQHRLQPAGRDMTAVGPGCGRFGRCFAQCDLRRGHPDRCECRGSDPRLAIHGDARVHQCHSPPLPEERPAESAGADQRRFDRVGIGWETGVVIHACSVRLTGR